MTRDDVLVKAIRECLKALYEQAQPKVTWEEFEQLNKEYKEGPKPYEFYYLDKDRMNEIVGMFTRAYRIPPEFKDDLEILKNYFENPVRDTYVTDENGYSSRGYEHFSPLKDIIGEDNYNKVISYIEEASNFYKWNRDLNAFNMSVYLGPSPNSNKQAVIDNWKKYKGIDITISDEEEN
ncbi:MAG: hypothetical protein ACI4OP_03915 [Candidatus Coprovivens sp.]